jgi:hypothetical protein
MELMSGFANILDFGADPTGLIGCDLAIAAAQASGLTVVVPDGTYLLEGTVSLNTGETWLLNGGQFIHSDDTIPMFSAAGVSDLTLLGHLKCKGMLSTQADTGESAVVFDGVNRCYVQRITATCFKGSAVKIAGVSAGSYRGDTLNIDSLAVHENKRGLDVIPGSGAEYCLIGSIEASGNILAARIGAGNTRIKGGNIVDNVDGIELVSGTNHGHGGLHGVSINHNSGFNLKATSVTYGFTINGCHFYGDSPSAGKVILQNCAGINIADGILSAMVEVIGTQYVNVIRDNFVTGFGAISGSGMASTRRTGNCTASGAWAGNNY